MREWIAVAIGGMIGSLARYAIQILLQNWIGKSFPLGTLVANVIGCFLIGLGWSFAEKHGWFQGPWELAWRVGFLGGLTTFSSFGLDVVKQAQTGQWGIAITLISLHLLLGLGAVVLGMNVWR